MRTVFRIHHSEFSGVWVASVEGRTVDFDRNKVDIVQRTANQCRDLLTVSVDSQIVIHGRDGRIQSERTYGNDPARRKG